MSAGGFQTLSRFFGIRRTAVLRFIVYLLFNPLIQLFLPSVFTGIRADTGPTRKTQKQTGTQSRRSKETLKAVSAHARGHRDFFTAPLLYESHSPGKKRLYNSQTAESACSVSYKPRITSNKPFLGNFSLFQRDFRILCDSVRSNFNSSVWT